MAADHPNVSYHGGHSGSYCAHAKDPLPEVVTAYLSAGFRHFALTEHQPRYEKNLYFDEEGLHQEDLFTRFDQFNKEARRQQRLWNLPAGAHILVGFETEMCGPDPVSLIKRLQRQYSPDIVVGSVHHVRDVPIDVNQDYFEAARIAVGGSVDAVQCEYYDTQLKLLQEIHPTIVGHMDLIDLFTPPSYTPSEAVLTRVRRNIMYAVDHDLVFEVNSRSHKKGRKEPYPNRRYLQMIADAGGLITLGDDSHGKDQVGLHYDQSVPIAREFFGSIVAFEINRGQLKRIPMTL